MATKTRPDGGALAMILENGLLHPADVMRKQGLSVTDPALRLRSSRRWSRR